MARQSADAKRLKNLIGGVWREARTDTYDDVYNPATGAVTAQVPISTGVDVEEAVAAAAKAFRSWRDASCSERSAGMFRYRHLLDQHRERIARMVTEEHGKVLAEARAEVARGIECVELASSVTTHMMGRNLENVATNVDVEMVRQPLGVVAGICPYNFRR